MRSSSWQTRDDTGSIAVLVIGFIGVIVLLIGVVTDASSTFLAHRSLDAATDGAALAAASALDESALYDSHTEALPLSQAAADAAVVTYVKQAGLRARYPKFAIVSVALVGQTVTVTFGCVEHLPFTNIAGAYAKGVHLTSVASARSPLR